MKVVITGGCGFIGTNLAIKLTSIGHDVISIDNMSTAVRQAPVSDHEQIIDHNLNNITTIENIFSDADLVFHFASSVGVKLIDDDPHNTLLNSFETNMSLLPVFERFNNRVIFASTSEVYGNRKDAKESDDLTIGSPEIGRWGYACSKLMMEFLLRCYSFPSVVVRFFNICGLYQTGKHGMVLPKFIHNATTDQDLIIYGDGKQTRAFCDVRDAVEMLLAVSNTKFHHELYNIGNQNNTITITQLAELVIKTCNSKSKIKYMDYGAEFSESHQDIHQRSPDTSKIQSLYLPRYDLVNTIEHVYNHKVNET